MYIYVNECKGGLMHSLDFLDALDFNENINLIQSETK